MTVDLIFTTNKQNKKDERRSNENKKTKQNKKQKTKNKKTKKKTKKKTSPCLHLFFCGYRIFNSTFNMQNRTYTPTIQKKTGL